MTFSEEELRRVHKLSIRHREGILRSQLCGCFYCLRTFAPDQVAEWTDNDMTVLCPRCGIDSVLGDADVPLSPELLTQMRDFWFGHPRLYGLESELP